jgi:hypothetical protein
MARGGGTTRRKAGCRGPPVFAKRIRVDRNGIAASGAKASATVGRTVSQPFAEKPGILGIGPRDRKKR